MEFAALPTEDQAEKVRQALDIVALGDSRLYEADRFLAAIRLSPSVWPVLHALIHSLPSQLYLTFAARTLHMRVRVEFQAFDERSRADAFSLAVEGALRSATLLQGSRSPVHYFSQAIGFAVGQASPPMREGMWQALNAKFTDPILRCNVLAAVVEETDEKSTLDIARHIETKEFCETKASEVVAVAMSLLQLPSATAESHALRLRASIACLHAWCKYGEKHEIALALMPLFSSAGLVGAVAETLADIVGFTDTALDLLASVCDGLTLTFRNTAAVSPNEVHHAIAEVCCALSEGNADDIMERKCDESRVVAQKVTELLWLCLKSPDDKAFCAALNGWSAWITAETFAKQWQRKLGKTQVALLVENVVQRMSTLQFVKAIMHPEQSDMVESSNEKAFVTGFLLQAAACLGTAEYIRVVCPLLTKPRNQSPYSICAALTALAAAGESMATFEPGSEKGEIIHVMLDAVLSLLESCHSVYNNTGSPHTIRACGLHLLSCYEAGLNESSDGMLLRAMRCAGAGILDMSVNEEAAQLLLDLAEMNGTRIVSFLPDLLTSCKQVLPRMPIKAAEKCVKALGILIRGLNEHDRCKAMEELLSDLCHGIRWAVREKRVHAHEDDICRSLTLICGAIEASRYDESCKRLFQTMQEDIFTMARAHCTRQDLSKCICRFLEVFAVPVLMEYGEEEEDGDVQRAAYTEERTQLAIQCAELTSETFLLCGCGAEAEWLGVLGEALDHVVSAADRGVHAAQACLSVSFTRATQGLAKLCERGYDTRPDVTIGYLRIANHLIGGCGNSLLPFVEGMTNVAMGCMRSTNASIVKQALLYFRQGFGYGQTGRMGEAVVTAGGGAGSVAAGVLGGARMRKCCTGVADVLYALVRVISGGCETGVMKELLVEGFRRNDVPLQGLDVAVRERLLAGCCEAVESSRRTFVRALSEIARACQRIVL